MPYKYKSFAYICFALSVVTKEIATKVAPDNSAELFDAILYQKLDNADDDIKIIYSAWSIIRQLIEANKAFLYRPYKEVLENILYGDTEYELADNFDTELLKGLSNLIDQNKRLLGSFYVIGADKYLDDLIKESD